MQNQFGKILSKVNLPTDLKNLTEEELQVLASDVRRCIIDVVATNHGHLASSLGVVELSIALHYVFDTPYDKLVWDVGHQAYPHKILTGRKSEFHTNRKLYGISGFPKISESEYDAFGVGHSSTSISAALGMAEASRLKGEIDRQHIAIIGDGSMTAGMAMEALNNAGVSNSNILVILNDNGIAIDPSVGAIHKYLTDVSTSKTYNRLKDDIWNMLGKMDKLGLASQKIASKIDSAIKTTLLKSSNMFESMNFRYFGPVNGHNLPRLVKVLSDLKDIPGPKVLHIITKKGKGLATAEQDPITFHAPGTFDSRTGELIKSIEVADSIPPKFQDVFGKTLLELAEIDEKIVGITPAMPTGSSFNFMMEKYPERVFDVGIAEQHAVTFAAGLAISGMKPFCNIYSSFMQRAYDQVVHDVALQKLPVVFCLDRAGLVGEDGPTHHGVFDLAYFRGIPNMIVAAPLDEWELRYMMNTAKDYKEGPFSIRFPRGRGSHVDWACELEKVEIGRGRQLRDGEDLAILSIGTVGVEVLKAIEKIESDKKPAVYDLRFLKPLDEELVKEVFERFDKIITIEDGALIGGLASAISELKNKLQFKGEIKNLGIADEFIEHGKPEELKAICGYDSSGIIACIQSFY
ncbi:1-deoxy-D-xylulose-5-phosphate synthase [Lentimicrobium sp. L6]|nr:MULTISPECIES: 1-deoxy-D-xylulose-5-phosphate synthase [unclassified Lentimicrobium]NPD44477.1 1-deoxy-D-xylulose-5-phosphate synthase [Lentimicrobium sp. S6]NPD84223.1 1-deoxy-D-xylulose-5-phosphate synthase [Lentimicrobium sp. L6]